MLLSNICGAVIAVISLAFVPTAPQGPYDMCGMIEAGVTCPKLFRDDAGALWLLQTYGSFQVGDRVRVTGTADPGCISICQQGNGCIYSNTIAACDPTVGFCFCTSGAPCGNTYATGGCANSTGVGAKLTGSGSTSVAADDLFLTASQLPPNVFGIVFMGPAQISIPFGDGLRCVGTGGIGVFRFPVRNAGTIGGFSEGPIVGHANAVFPPSGHIAAGSTWLFQAWYRDPSGPCGGLTNVSNAVSATFVP